MKEDIIFHTQHKFVFYDTKGTNVKRIHVSINGYIYHVYNRRLFGLIPLPDKLKADIKILYTDDFGSPLNNVRLQDFSESAQQHIENTVKNMKEMIEQRTK